MIAMSMTLLVVVLSMFSSDAPPVATLEQVRERDGRAVYLYTANEGVEFVGMKTCAVLESGEWSQYPARSDKSGNAGVIFARDYHEGYWIGNAWYVSVPKSRRFYLVANADAVVEPLLAWVVRGVNGVDSWGMLSGPACENRIRLPLYFRQARSP